MNRTKLSVVLLWALALIPSGFAFGSTFSGPMGGSSSGSAALTNTYVGYGAGGVLSGEAAFAYTAASNTLTVDSITSNSNTDLTLTGGGTGIIQAADSMTFATGKTITNDTYASATTNGDLTLTPNGTGGLLYKGGSFKLATAAAAQGLQFDVDASNRGFLAGGSAAGGGAVQLGTAYAQVGAVGARSATQSVFDVVEAAAIGGASTTWLAVYGGGMVRLAPSGPQTLTCSGATLANADITNSFVKIINNNAGGCAIGIIDTSTAGNGTIVTLYVESTAGGNITFTDAAGSFNGGTCSLDSADDTMTMIEAGGQWLMTGCMNN